ncbi:hypothetical protein [Methyloceanibacter marginalis]|uniref:hypothetical protein n=1 Tax=Methyloceanibacter marginalis TaxID=1774971 RepID=UPI001FCD4E21|nr:hypothetical protein [Methyloceanibacter marginalis]
MAKTCHPENTAPIGRRKFMETASLVVAAIVSARAAKAETVAQPVLSAETPATPLVNPGKPMTSDLTAAQVREALQLEPNQTCGFVRNTYKSKLDIAPGGLPAPFAQGRPLGTALFFMMRRKRR